MKETITLKKKRKGGFRSKNYTLNISVIHTHNPSIFSCHFKLQFNQPCIDDKYFTIDSTLIFKVLITMDFSLLLSLLHILAYYYFIPNSSR